MKVLASFKAPVTMREKATHQNCVVEAKIKNGKGKWRECCYLQMNKPDFMEALQYFGMECEVEIHYPERFILSEEHRGKLSLLGIHIFVRALAARDGSENIYETFSPFEQEVLSRVCDALKK